jgi:serine/threonine protein kinase
MDKVFLGKYRVTTTKSLRWWEELRGRFGVTCQAEEIGSGRKVALELVPAFLLGEAEREQLRRAAAAARQIQHANLPALYDFGEEGEQFVYVMEQVQGVSARESIEACGPMAIAPALAVVLQVADALASAGRYQIHHAGLCPDNLLIIPGQINENGWSLVKILPHFGGSKSAPAPDIANPGLAAAAAAFASP